MIADGWIELWFVESPTDDAASGAGQGGRSETSSEGCHYVMMRG